MSVFLFSGTVFSQAIPTSSRSRKAVATQTPILKKEYKESDLKWGSPIFMRLFKEEMKLEIWVKQSETFVFFKDYDICTYGGMGLGPKLKQGDGSAPEGFYYVNRKRLNPYSSFHLSFNLGYPNTYDRARHRTGSALMVHGNCVSIGCYAMTNSKIEEIYSIAESALRGGQFFFRVHVFPFKMTDSNMAKHQSSKWYSFWQNLQTGYLHFENTKRPPNVTVRNKKYVFN